MSKKFYWNYRQIDSSAMPIGIKVSIISVGMLLLSFAHTSFAGAAWYAGQVSRIALVGGSDFVVTMKGGVLDDCLHKYVYFYTQEIGEGRVKNAYALAITSLTTGLKMGVVIDKAINGSGGQCNAAGMTADLSAN